MAAENHDGPQEPAGDLPDPIRQAMRLHAQITAEGAWWVFAIASYAAHPDANALEALADAAKDYTDGATLIKDATKDLVEWIEGIKAERRRDG